MSKTSIFLLIILLLAVGTLFAVNDKYATNPVLKSLPNIFPTQSVASENTLTLSPSTLVAPSGKTSAIAVLIESKGEKPSLIQLELAYEPAMFQKITIQPGSFYQNPQVLLSKINANNGRISYALAPTVNQEDATNSNLVATILVTPSSNAVKRETNMHFLPKTVVRTDKNENTLKIAYGSTIRISSITQQLASPSGLLR